MMDQIADLACVEDLDNERCVTGQLSHGYRSFYSTTSVVSNLNHNDSSAAICCGRSLLNVLQQITDLDESRWIWGPSDRMELLTCDWTNPKSIHSRYPTPTHLTYTQLDFHFPLILVHTSSIDTFNTRQLIHTADLKNDRMSLETGYLVLKSNGKVLGASFGLGDCEPTRMGNSIIKFILSLTPAQKEEMKRIVKKVLPTLPVSTEYRTETIA